MDKKKMSTGCGICVEGGFNFQARRMSEMEMVRG